MLAQPKLHTFSRHDWSYLGDLWFLTLSRLTTQFNTIANGTMPCPNISSVTLSVCVRVCVICVCMNVFAITKQPKVYNQFIGYETSTIYWLMASNKYFSFILRTHLLLLTLTQCWSIIPGANASYKMSTVFWHMHGMRQLLLFLYSKPTPSKSSLLLILASAYPS